MTFYMLDTDISSYIIKERPVNVLERFRKVEMDSIGISIVTYAELIYGVERSSSKRINRSVVEDFTRHLNVHEWNVTAVDEYAIIRTALESKGTPIGAMDMMIAAHSKSLNSVLVTNNPKHFRQVAGLTIENWV